MRVGANLRSLRLRNGFSQEYVSKELSMTQGNYSKLERDKFFPSGSVIEKLAKLYNVLEEELLVQVSRPNQSESRPTLAKRNLVSNEDLIKVSGELEYSKDTIIALQARQIELLELQIRTLNVRKGDGVPPVNR
jgi:transcriptional regulator with XRE-family HTH domain